MPLELLREIAAADLPLSVSDESTIDKLRVLAASGMLVADLPDPQLAGVATVKAVTGLGRATLKLRDVRGGPALPPLSHASQRRFRTSSERRLEQPLRSPSLSH